MTYQVTITAGYPREADTVFAEACHFAELVEAMRGIARYDGLPGGEAQEGETYVVDVTLFGLVRNPGHTMHVERLDRAARVIQSREHNRSVSRWDPSACSPGARAVSGPTRFSSIRRAAAGSPHALRPSSMPDGTTTVARCRSAARSDGPEP